MLVEFATGFMVPAILTGSAEGLVARIVFVAIAASLAVLVAGLVGWETIRTRRARIQRVLDDSSCEICRADAVDEDGRCGRCGVRPELLTAVRTEVRRLTALGRLGDQMRLAARTRADVPDPALSLVRFGDTTSGGLRDDAASDAMLADQMLMEFELDHPGVLKLDTLSEAVAPRPVTSSVLMQHLAERWEAEVAALRRRVDEIERG